MLRTFDALIVTPMRGLFLPRSYRSIPQPRGVFSTVLLKSVAVCLYASHTAVIASSVGMFPYKFCTSMLKMMVPGGSEHGNLSFMAERYCSVFFRCAGIKGRSWVTILSRNQVSLSRGSPHADTMGRRGTSFFCDFWASHIALLSVTSLG